MQSLLLAAAIVAALVGVVHSVLGEMLVFCKLRSQGLVPTDAAPPLQSRNVRILWATWHLASAFGFGFAAILWHFSRQSAALPAIVAQAIVASFVLGSLLVLVATRGRHPGWAGLLIVALLVYFAGAR